MLNKLKFNTLSLSFLFLMFVLAWGTTTAFAAETTIYNPSFVMTANGEVTISNLDDITPNKHVYYNVTDSEGNPVRIAVYYSRMKESVNKWIIAYCGSGYSHFVAQFAMIVSFNSHVIGIGQPYIQTTHCTTSNLLLKMTNQSGTLSFNVGDGNNDASLTLTGMIGNNKIYVVWSLE